MIAAHGFAVYHQAASGSKSHPFFGPGTSVESTSKCALWKGMRARRHRLVRGQRHDGFGSSPRLVAPTLTRIMWPRNPLKVSFSGVAPFVVELSSHPTAVIS